VLDAINPWGRPIRPSLGAEIIAGVASEPWQLLGYRELRRAIFAEEQGLFQGSDFDEHDAHALPIVAESQIAGMADRVVGVVRIFRSEPGTWYGGRLGVRREFRRFGAIGTALISSAVSTAHAHGCQRFLATVQVANVRYFERHHFRALREVSVLGRPHQLMQADLGCYPPRADGERIVQARVA
jgi:putative N-acetyltransferase (TIGR04045 family)